MEPQRTGHVLKALAAAVVVVAGLKLVEPLIIPLFLAATLAAASAPVALWVRARGAADEFEPRLPAYTARLAHATEQLSVWLGARGVRVSPESLYAIADPGSL